MYNDVITALSGARTLKDHISKLQKILDTPPVDPALASALRAAITDLMPEQALAIKKKLSSQTIRLDNARITTVKQLHTYCHKKALTGLPQWVIAAQSAGWTPPTP
ncbi:TPA: hypothetical protein ACHF2V_004233 [Citrobacter farmeri]|jgi:hypothetical protein|uniref:hypothetical protein n=1 Tax=Citrobacter TaxID=544 RepID=UPI0011407B40|nr:MULTISPECIES: hypothetical protein [Citrobacter]MEC3933927.1 hypothetical protein [Citrobacter farmeri]UBI23120.1 hypothetical protein LA348_24120 [Citrobacter amalonaticus]BCU51094.1 hypothetical protein CIAM_46150 [Citrobacter amalonaticus]HCD1278518.1 hypothetical protein [Citrobacter amalonaticus]HCW7018847.1 hypothetical protein [Citrobacter farmeri]